MEAPNYFYSTQQSDTPPNTPPNAQPNVSYVPPPPQYGYGPPPNAPPNASYPPPQYGYGPPPNAPPNANYPPPPQYGYQANPGYGYNAAAYDNSGIYAKKPKSKLAAGLLAILVGYGIYNFYLKYYAKAICQLVGTLISAGFIIYWSMEFFQDMMEWTMIMTGNPSAYFFPNIFTPAYIIGMIISMGIGLWQLVEGILILVGKINRDGSGNPLR